MTKWKSHDVKAARAEVIADVIKNYFSHLEKWVIVPPECIYNFDKTNYIDDADAKTIICRRDWNRVQRKLNPSKTSINVMFCKNAAGDLIPPMVVDKLQSHETWKTGGYDNMVYDCTATGWFGSHMFETWFFK